VRTLCFLLAIALPASANEEFFEAARRGDTAALKAFLDKGIPVDSKWRYDQTALLIAARLGHTSAVKLLVERGADVNAKDSFYGFTPLGAVAQKRNVELVKMLLEKGAAGGDQLLPPAVTFGQTDVVKAIAGSGKPSAEAMSNALALAVASDATNIAEILKAAGAKPPVEPSLDAALLGRYAGSYRNANGNEISFALANGRLQATAFGQVSPLRAVDATTFAPLPFPAMRFIFYVDGDRALSVEFVQGQMKQSYARVEAK
jgi:ankyrin repeat protein